MLSEADRLADVLRATEYVIPAIEIVDARLQDQRKITDTVADNGAAAGIALEGRPVGPMDVDLRWVGGIMYKNSETEETGLAAGVLYHPALGVAWPGNQGDIMMVQVKPLHDITHLGSAELSPAANWGARDLERGRARCRLGAPRCRTASSNTPRLIACLCGKSGPVRFLGRSRNLRH